MTIVKTKKGNHLHLEPTLWLKIAVEATNVCKTQLRVSH
jgi:hypothetical protein